MSCDDVKRNLSAFLTCRLGRHERERLRNHRQLCADCDRLMTLAEEMTCREFTELLNDYVEGAMSTARRRVFDRHLSACPDCAAYLQSYKATMKLSVFAMRDETRERTKGSMRHLAEDLPEGLVEAFLAATVAEEREQD